MNTLRNHEEIGNLEIRRMTIADIPSAMEIAAGIEHIPHYSSSIWRKILNGVSAPPRIALAAAAPHGNLRAFAVAGLLPPQVELEMVAVSPTYQRQGIGRRLLLRLIEDLRRDLRPEQVSEQAEERSGNKVEELWLEVRASNARALALYRQLGFRETGRRFRYYSDPIEDAILMSLRL